ncbi:exopolysaccharide biosynthesis polyprenyl glycosylphosphotransferase [Bradyrhizobium sp. USDA 4461]
MQWPNVLGASGVLARHLARNHRDRRGVIRGGIAGEADRSDPFKPQRSTTGDGRRDGRSQDLRLKRAGTFRSRIAREREQIGPNCRFKRAFDLIVAASALVILLLPIIMIAIAVKIETRGPILFRQWRGGRGGQRFQILKFRTMTCMEDGAHVCQARPGDSRVTRIGRVLRKTSLDELPQLFNVLWGDMSVVGPRPHALVHDAMYSRLITRYAYRHSVRPGMTGWAQVNGCRGETRDLTAMEKRVARDLAYIRHWSFRLDLVILAMTVREVLRPRNAC